MSWKTCLCSVGIGLLLVMVLGGVTLFTQASALRKFTVSAASEQLKVPYIGIVKPIPEPKPMPGPSENPKPEPL